MTDEQLQIFKKAMSIMVYIANNTAMGNAYESWSTEYRCKDIDSVFKNVKDNEDVGSHKFWKSVFALPEEQKRLLGFLWWDKAEDDTRMCIPIWIWQCLPDDMEFDGKPKKDLDNDVRLGCVWWRA